MQTPLVTINCDVIKHFFRQTLKKYIHDECQIGSAIRAESRTRTKNFNELRGPSAVRDTENPKKHHKPKKKVDNLWPKRLTALVGRMPFRSNELSRPGDFSLGKKEANANRRWWHKNVPAINGAITPSVHWKHRDILPSWKFVCVCAWSSKI